MPNYGEPLGFGLRELMSRNADIEQAINIFDHAIIAAQTGRYVDMLIDYYNAVNTLGKGMRGLPEQEVRFLLGVMQQKRSEIADALLARAEGRYYRGEGAGSGAFAGAHRRVSSYGDGRW
jgi:hypothetical protein